MAPCVERTVAINGTRLWTVGTEQKRGTGVQSDRHWPMGLLGLGLRGSDPISCLAKGR